MSERPILSKELDSKSFLNFYYLKEELIDFCRENGLPVSGGKLDLTERIAHFLDTGMISKISSNRKVTTNIEKITENTKIESNIICSEKHRAFFKEKIGKSFSFNVLFQKWLKNNAGKTYAQAIEAYYQILGEKKNNRTVIDKQFEYNSYIRDFLKITKVEVWKKRLFVGNIKKVCKGIIVMKNLIW